MSQYGWIKLHRQITENDLWQDKPFARGQAWVDLLLLADARDGECFYQGKIQPTHMGEVRTSILYLSQRWGWGNRKVKSFLENLKDVGMIDFKCTSKCTSIFIVNYAKFSRKKEDNAQQNAHQMHNKCITNAYQMHTHKNIIRNNKEIKEKGATLHGTSVPTENQYVVPDWLDVGDDFDGLSDESKAIRIKYRKRDKLNQLKTLADSYGLQQDEATALAQECMNEHDANAEWLVKEIKGEL